MNALLPYHRGHLIQKNRGIGGIFSNLFRTLLKDIQVKADKGFDIDVCAIGKKATSFFGRLPVTLAAQVTQLGETPSANELIGSVKVMLDAYESGHIDSLYLVFKQSIEYLLHCNLLLRNETELRFQYLLRA